VGEDDQAAVVPVVVPQPKALFAVFVGPSAYLLHSVDLRKVLAGGAGLFGAVGWFGQAQSWDGPVLLVVPRVASFANQMLSSASSSSKYVLRQVQAHSAVLERTFCLGHEHGWDQTLPASLLLPGETLRMYSVEKQLLCALYLGGSFCRKGLVEWTLSPGLEDWAPDSP
jgi:hypothetical protein